MFARKAAASGIVAGRFELKMIAGSGGMGTVYQATDTHTGKPVAVKLLHAERSEHDLERFVREAQLLRELQHPGIVAYLAHGETESGDLYLAMEWLEGEDLSQRLSRGALSMDEARILIRRVAEALAFAHARDVIHRDLKPSNLFLRAGDVDRVAIVDFGIARRGLTSQVVTATGVLVGTPAYMAPEQARGEKVLTSASDIFSLGCVFFECLTGRQPFTAEQPMAVLARILFDDAPRIRTINPEIPIALEILVDRMLVKEPSERVPDAAALLEALDRLGELRSSLLPTPGKRGGEQALLSVLMATVGNSPSFDSASEHAIISQLKEELAAHDAKLEILADGSLVAILEHAGAATDQVGRAAQCAILIRARFPGATIALSTGRGSLQERAADGEVFGRAAALLRGSVNSPDSEQILLDEVSRGLLEVRFMVQKNASGVYVLTGEELALDASRPLLGKPTPCVGRDIELGLLENALGGCVEDAEPRAVLVIAPPGAGKSRLRHEFVRRLEKRGENISIWIGRSDPLSIGSSYGLLGQAVRRLCGILDSDDIEVRQAKLSERVRECIAKEHQQRVEVFLGELCSVPFSDADNVKLRAARQDPLVMRTQLTQAMLDFVRAECARHTVLWVLEDLHWSDALTVKLCDVVLRELAGCPFMILALARPEIEQLFPNLWGSQMQRVELRPLGKKASERLVQQVLGNQISVSMVARIVAQSEGNALFLEELIRAAAEGRGDEAPETVLAMLQARIGRLEAGPRRVLRAASVFGETCWRGGIHTLLGASFSDREIDDWMRPLIQDELLEERLESRFSGEKEYRFRHALMRDAAYGLLIDADRQEAHALAGAYLEQMGERDPLVLAEHYQRGGDNENAIRCYVRAAKEVFERHDMKGAVSCTEAGIACGASGADRSTLCALQASAYFWLDEPARTSEIGDAVLPDLPVGSYPWCKLVGALLVANAGLGREEAVMRLGQALLATEPTDDGRSACVEAICHLHNMFCWFGEPEIERPCLARIDTVGKPIWDSDPIARGWTCVAHCFANYFIGVHPGLALQWATKGVEAFAEVGDERNRVAAEIIAGLACSALGDQERAIQLLRQGLRHAQRVGQPFPISYAEIQLALVLAGNDTAEHHEEAVSIAEPWIRPNAPSLMFQGLAHDVLARVVARRGDLLRALEHARTASERLSIFKPYRLFALATQATLHLALGQTQDAMDAATLGVEIAMKIGGPGEIPVRIALTEALEATGRHDQARESLRQTMDHLRLRLATIADPTDQERFLTHVPANARTAELAQAWLGIDVRN